MEIVTFRIDFGQNGMQSFPKTGRCKTYYDVVEYFPSKEVDNFLLDGDDFRSMRKSSWLNAFLSYGAPPFLEVGVAALNTVLKDHEINEALKGASTQRTIQRALNWSRKHWIEGDRILLCLGTRHRADL